MLVQPHTNPHVHAQTYAHAHTCSKANLLSDESASKGTKSIKVLCFAQMWLRVDLWNKFCITSSDVYFVSLLMNHISGIYVFSLALFHCLLRVRKKLLLCKHLQPISFALVPQDTGVHMYMYIQSSLSFLFDFHIHCHCVLQHLNVPPNKAKHRWIFLFR